jgi:hypothetical protein
MSEVSPKLREELIALAEEDQRVRDRLAAEGALSEGYNTIMEAVHQHNAARLRIIIDEHGWPGEMRFGKDGAEAAWRIAQHAIGEPAFQRRCLDLLYDAVERGEAPAWQAAFLEDRVRMFEGRGQLYGTQFDIGLDGLPVPFPIEKPAEVDARRASVGLEPLADQLAKAQPVAPIDPEVRARRERAYQQWLRDVGWRR